MTGATPRTTPNAPGAERTQLVTFRVGDDLFAADIFSVERVLRFTAPRPIPNVPAWLDGVIDYGGRVVPVIDLRARFELGPAERRDGARILVVVAGEDWIGAIVDGVDEVLTVASSRLSAPPPLFKGLAKPYVRALVRAKTEEDPVIVVLDVAQLLTARERIVLEQAVAGAKKDG
ncbi:MAG TPA: chemotaxis protein CheW [Gemmatimonadaceae bacterium]|nr:chemotaxis protein CheW [Gemmatimonadaceae bacterium]